MSESFPEQFHALHSEGTFILPNPWDVGSAKILESLGFAALATTSSGHAASLGRHDQAVTRDEMLRHVESIVQAIAVPLNVDSERCFADDPAGVEETVRLIGETGAAGCSIEDYDPEAGAIVPIDRATEMVAAAVDAARATAMVVTARAEGLLYGSTDLDEIVARLRAFSDVGAHVVYAPGLVDAEDISAIVQHTGSAVNVLALPNGPTIGELAALGVRRVSTGGALAFAAYGTLADAGRELLTQGTSTYTHHTLKPGDRSAFA